MSGNQPPVILRTSSSLTSSPPNNASAHTNSNRTNETSPIIIQQTNLQASSISPRQIRSLVVKPHRDPTLQLAGTSSTQNQNVDVKPIVIQARDTSNNQHPHKKIALEPAHFHNPSISFTAVPKSEVFNTLTSPQTSTYISPTNVNQPTSSIPSFSTIRLINPSSYVPSHHVHPITTSTQPVLLQQHRNVVLQQPIIAVQVQNDPTTIQKENQLQNISLATDSSTTDSKPSTNDYIPIQYQRKPCNCTKSMCLKLYCDCFANGLHCQNCSCLNCHNDLRHEDDRRKAINATLERNPNAFKSKMYKFRKMNTANSTTTQSDRPLKGCNCKKSSCHKRYCECYEARVPCTSLCKCVGCKNTEQSVHPMNVGFYRSGQPKSTAQTPLDQIPRTGPPIESTAPNNVFNLEVTEALASCLLITGQQCETNQMNERDSQEAILKEFQRCMHHIVQSALGRSIAP